MSDTVSERAGALCGESEAHGVGALASGSTLAPLLLAGGDFALAGNTRPMRATGAAVGTEKADQRQRPGAVRRRRAGRGDARAQRRVEGRVDRTGNRRAPRVRGRAIARALHLAARVTGARRRATARAAGVAASRVGLADGALDTSDRSRRIGTLGLALKVSGDIARTAFGARVRPAGCSGCATAVLLTRLALGTNDGRRRIRRGTGKLEDAHSVLPYVGRAHGRPVGTDLGDGGEGEVGAVSGARTALTRTACTRTAGDWRGRRAAVRCASGVRTAAPGRFGRSDHSRAADCETADEKEDRAGHGGASQVHARPPLHGTDRAVFLARLNFLGFRRSSIVPE